MDWLTVFVVSVMVVVGAFCGFFYVKILKKPMIGHLVGGIIVGIIGSVLIGYFLGLLEGVFLWLITNPLHVNFFSTFAGGFLLVWIFSRVSHQE